MKRESRVATQIAYAGCFCPPQQFFMASRLARPVCAPAVVFSLAIFVLGLCGLERPVADADDARAADASDNNAAPKGLTAEGAVAFVQSYCIDCHVGEDAESGLDLEGFASVEDVAGSIEAWNRIATRVHEGQMPPPESDTPSQATRAAFVDWIRDTIYQAVCDDGVSPGGPMLRRLNRTEYANTVRDLLGIPINAGHALPDDGAGGEGFDNAAETLFISPIYAEKYLDAARSAIGHALKDPDDRKRIITATPNDKRSPEQAAREVLAGFLPRAFRRPAGAEEIDEYTQLFNRVYEEDQSYTSAIEFTLVAAMVSPKFLFLFEQAGETDEPTLVSHYEMASRLSYFLWASMPDDELMRLAAQGKLHDDDVLEQQVARMLRSDVDRRGLRRGAKVREFATSFVEQWLGTRALGREFKPDKSIAGRYDSELEGGMKYEPIFFFEDLLADNRSLLNLIDSDFTYVNRTLARHYKVKGEFREQPKKVELSEKDRRGGLLGMSAVLAVSSFPHRTSPVLRGKWVLETLLGTPPPPAPPNVPALEEAGDAAQPTSLRERLELHRSDPVCASCHQAMDPLGFGLENYDVLGRWRTDADGVAIDASGQLPSGETFNGPDELKGLLMDRKEQFMRNLTSKMLGYALARGLTNEDACVVESITRKLAEDDYKAQTLILEIVKSIPFRYKQGS
ncbi:Planctomycete cytochrome C [Stieleria neptunia]|uniref:Planctomycete cytochrome C n=2 Tax=Stieleria neptunia TaxID=2527979 RepID=A0A518HRH7_9BACT|nr:Planctomycete cytochrome C [Stieleria neptunia]